MAEDEFPRFEIHARSTNTHWRIVGVFYSERDANSAAVALARESVDATAYRVVKVFGPVTF